MTFFHVAGASMMIRRWMMIMDLMLLLLLLLMAVVYGVSFRFTSQHIGKVGRINLSLQQHDRTDTRLYEQSPHQQQQQQQQDDSIISERNTKDSITGITLKMAFDSNWAVADTAEVKSERFTSPSSLDLVHRLRRDSDAVLVGRTTVERDNCTLTVRRVALAKNNNKKQPVRVVVDPNLQLLQQESSDTIRYAMFHDGLETIVYCTDKAMKQVNTCIQLPEELLLIPLPVNDDNKIATIDIIKDLSNNRGVHHVMVEGGPATARQFLQEGLVDRAILIRAPMTFAEPVESHISVDTLTKSGLELLGTSISEGDVVEYWSKPDLPWPTSDLTDWP